MVVDPAIIPANEAERIKALRRYDILDTPPDGTFDNVTKLAAKLFGVPIAIISLVDSDRIWFKSHHGVDVPQIDRDPGLCASGILGDSPYVLTNAIEDPRSLANPLVAGSFGLRFYVGVPLKTHDDYNLGMLCCLDAKPRSVSQAELDDLSCLGQLVMDQMEVRLAARRIDELRHQIAQSQERMKLAVRAGNVGVWGLDMASQRFDWDEQMHALYESRPSDFAYSPAEWLNLVAQEDRPRVTQAWNATVGRGVPFEQEFRVLTLDGQMRYLKGLAQAFSGADGRTARVLGTNWDVTAERLASEALRRAKETAEAAERAKSSFLANMSHELRTPLNAIIGFAEVMKHDSSLSKVNREYINIVNHSGSHLLSLINEVLDMAKVESGRIELLENDLNLPSFLNAVAAMIGMRAERKDLRLVRDFDARLPEFVKTDELKLRQILLNLLSNAIKFTAKGEVVLKVAYQPSGLPQRGRLHVEVRDTGPGMSAEELGKLFTPFQQGQAGRKSQEGTGLGLVLSQKFVELMGGSIRVQSTPGVGSSFAFDIALTVAESGRAQDTLREVAALAPGQARKKILVVDDVPLIRTVMERLLETVGFEICTAGNGREAVEAFQRFEPDFIWTDLVMPEMNGDEAARQIRQLPGGDKVRIVCMTASALVEDRARILESGVDDVLFKPIRESVLLATMQSLLGLQYIYRDEVMEAGPAVSDEDLLESANLSYMEKSWRESFHAATLSGDTDKIQSMVQTLAATHQELALVLQTLLDELQLERLELFARLQLKPRAP
ncbi:hypothetical protein DIC66_21475 [Rhodoferax lacus]|uniref:Virulence sensor protein BvgS n=1 Tax=Rhodoferax lacus TaxID=2184758 RepID=A0A3E1R722_9BURK|nr:GAF domain-containing hybrid sensor histidine kinase/response regulator [Rhodoferax lacus]RFO94842.1 hypothetical protein DIC66_21475 [Rhodoferax lacus]